jgi:hypothetical protein
MKNINDILQELYNHPHFLTTVGIFDYDQAHEAWVETLEDIFNVDSDDYDFETFWDHNKSKLVDCIEMGEYHHYLDLHHIVKKYYNL